VLAGTIGVLDFLDASTFSLYTELPFGVAQGVSAGVAVVSQRPRAGTHRDPGNVSAFRCRILHHRKLLLPYEITIASAIRSYLALSMASLPTTSCSTL
jgi:hypothetical protein